jgi:hypothetical protein
MVDAAWLSTEVDGIGPVFVGRPGQAVHAVSILIVGETEKWMKAVLTEMSIAGHVLLVVVHRIFR